MSVIDARVEQVYKFIEQFKERLLELFVIDFPEERQSYDYRVIAQIQVKPKNPKAPEILVEFTDDAIGFVLMNLEIIEKVFNLKISNRSFETAFGGAEPWVGFDADFIISIIETIARGELKVTAYSIFGKLVFIETTLRINGEKKVFPFGGVALTTKLFSRLGLVREETKILEKW